MKSSALKAYQRQLNRRLGTKKVRAAGRVPAVIYGRQTEPVNLEVDTKELEDLMHQSVSEHVLIDLAIADDSKPSRLVLIQEVQHHPLTGHTVHVDFHEVAEDEKVTMTVPVETVGEAEGVKTGGGILEHVLFNIKVRALPRDLPEYLQVDVSNLNLGDSIHLGEIPAPEGVEILGDGHVPVVSVATPRVEATETTAVEGVAAPTEPEVIKEKKEEAKAEPAKS